MKTFINFSENKSFLDDLLEYSIYDSKYGVGEKVVVKIDKINTVSEFLGVKIDASTILTKVSPSSTAKEVQVGSGGDQEVYLEVGGKTFVLKGSAATIKNYFNGYKDGTGITWKADSIETAQCLGLYYDANAALAKIGKAGGTPSSSVTSSIKSEIKSALGGGQDWDSGGVAKITSKLDDISLGDMNLLLGLAAGMQLFWEKVGKSSLGTAYITHGKIKSYYSAEENNPTIEVRGSKANAADVIISNVPSDKLLLAMKKGKVEYDNKSTCTIVDTNIKFLQISLKKAKGAAQLGKITAMLQKKYNLPKYEVMLKTLLDEGYLDEGFGDFFSGVWKKIKGFVGKLKSWVKGLTKKFSQTFDKKVKGDLNDLQRQFDKMSGPKINLKEAFKFDEQGFICEGLNSELKKLDVPKLNIVRKGIEKRLSDFSSAASSPTFSYKKTGRLHSKNMKDVGDIYKLFSNYTGVYVSNEVISANLGDMNKLKKEMIAMQKEMLFGKTTLPVWKVYGIGGGGDPWENLQGAKEFEEGKESSFAGLVGAVCGFHANSTDGGNYYALESSFLYNVDPEGVPTYTLNRMGTNQGGSNFSFVFEGATTIDAKRFVDKYGKASK